MEILKSASGTVYSLTCYWQSNYRFLLIFIVNLHTDREFIIYAMCQQVRADTLTIYYCKKQIDVSSLYVCPATDNEFHHNIVKVL